MNYNVEFINKTPLAISIGISQKLPKVQSLTSIAWVCIKVLPGMKTLKSWKEKLGVSLCDYIYYPECKVCMQSLYYEAELGDVWEVYSDNYLQLRKVENSNLRDQARVFNPLHYSSNIGLGIDGVTTLIEDDVKYNDWAFFIAPIENYIGIYHGLMFHGSLNNFFCYENKKLDFKNGLNNAIVTAYVDISNIKLDI